MVRKRKKKENPAEKFFHQGVQLVKQNTLFMFLYDYARIDRSKNNLCSENGWAAVTSEGAIYVNYFKKGAPEEWLYVISHCLLHLGLQHFKNRKNQKLWNVACDYWVNRFLNHLKIGRKPDDMEFDPDYAPGDEESLYQNLMIKGKIPNELMFSGTGGNANDMIFVKAGSGYLYWKPPEWEKLLSQGIAYAVTDAVEQAAGVVRSSDSAGKKKLTKAQIARNWFISSYPLLGSLAAACELVEDTRLCTRMNISLAAVDAGLKEIYINNAAGLTQEEYRFVIAHELLHVGLCHHSRAQGRDPYLWNVACDFVINGWLVEMAIGDMPRSGALYDPDLKSLSAEAVYDRIVTDRRRFRKLSTFCGKGVGDILAGVRPGWWETGAGIDLDEFYRRSLTRGLDYHYSETRGLLPAGLVEEIRALNQPVIPWDVELARWFDEYFSPLEKRRTYARASRRQSATPDIPRPAWKVEDGATDNRTFGVILDTSGSMDRNLLAKALGTIASYSISRDVPLVRVIFCDATFYDQGYMAPEDIAGTVKVKGRGGTVIQPAINMIEKSETFPKQGPLLIITDGWCDTLRIRREHAFLLPKGRHLPFVPKGDVFYIS